MFIHIRVKNYIVESFFFQWFSRISFPGTVYKKICYKEVHILKEVWHLVYTKGVCTNGWSNVDPFFQVLQTKAQRDGIYCVWA